MATYLVTGAAGFIGSNIVDYLLAEGNDVRGIDNFETGYRRNLAPFENDEAFTFVEGDIRDDEDVAEAMTDVDYVLHQAAIASVPRSVEAPKPSVNTNCLGTTTVLEEARNADASKVVVASSSSVYGANEELPKRESMRTDPKSPYALTKFFTERLAVQYDDFYDLETVALRYFNIFGPRQDPNGAYAAVIPKFVNLMTFGERPTIYGDGEQSRDFTYVENVVRANVAAAESDVSGEVFNIGCNDRITLNDLVDRLNDILDTDIEPIYDDSRPGDVKHSLAAIEKAKRHLDYDVVVGFDEGLRRTVDFFD